MYMVGDITWWRDHILADDPFKERILGKFSQTSQKNFILTILALNLVSAISPQPVTLQSSQTPQNLPLQVLFHLSFPPLAQILLLHPVIALIILSCIFPWYRPSLVLHKSSNSLSPPLWRCYTDVWLQSKVFFHYRT